MGDYKEEMMEQVAIGFLIGIGFYGVVLQRNIIKISFGMAILVAGFSLLLPNMNKNLDIFGMVCSIGRGAVVAIMLLTSLRLYEKYGSFDINKIRRLKE